MAKVNSMEPTFHECGGVIGDLLAKRHENLDVVRGRGTESIMPSSWERK